MEPDAGRAAHRPCRPHRAGTPGPGLQLLDHGTRSRSGSSTCSNDRIGIFEETVGGLDPILGDTEADLKRIFQLGEAEREQGSRSTRRTSRSGSAEAREAEEKLRDFIMETKSFSKDVVTGSREGTAHTPRRHGALRSRPPGRRQHLAAGGTGRHFQTRLPRTFISDYPQHTKDLGTKRTVTFRPDVAPDSEHVEYLTLGHPVIDDLVERVTQQRYDGSATGVVIPADAGLEPGTGWLVVHQITVPG